MAGLVADAGLLRGAALRPEGLTEDSVLRVAAHLRTRERMDALFVLTLAQNALELWEERLIDEFHRVLVDCLGIDGVGEERTSSVVDRNRDAALELAGRRPHIADRISAAPLAYLISESPEAIARHANLLEPVPARSRFRVNVHAEEMDVWRVEITTRDQLGLLAITTGVLEQAGLDVQDAVLATWGDGAALQAFRVKSELIGMVPDPAAIERALPKAATVLLGALPAPDAEVSFDDVASPWHTLAEVHATDRRGLLHALAVAFAVAGADVHAASITTNEAMAFDRFDLTDRNGRKLDTDMKAAIRDALQFGVRGELRRGGLFGWANKVATISKHSGDS